MILHFEGSEGRTSQIEITKAGRKWTYFTATVNRYKYRVDNTSGEVQVAPYWNKTKMWIEEA